MVTSGDKGGRGVFQAGDIIAEKKNLVEIFSFLLQIFHEPEILEDGPCLIPDLNLFLTQPIGITHK